MPLPAGSRARQFLVGLLFCCCPVCVCQVRSHSVLCADGAGTFNGTLFDKVQVHVGATRKGALAVRSCEATLTWNKHELAVAADVLLLDLDAFGVDFGQREPSAAFQIKKSKGDCCMTYQIYSLGEPPKLLRTLTGGSFFAAADTDLDGQVEIWTDDAAAIGGIDNLVPAELDFAPTMVLRFEQDKLLDVTSQFAADFDKQIAQLKAQLRPEDLHDFKNSDGRLQNTLSSPADQIHRLREVKAKVLEIAWSYLYSGREQEAWRSLSEMWPASDVDRIRGILLNARAHGMRTQLDGVSTASPEKKKTVRIFDYTHASPTLTQHSPDRLDAAISESPSPITEPIPITLRTFEVSGASEQALPQGEVTVILTIDSAGKVRSATPIRYTDWKNMDLMSALSEWKFVPAFKGHRAVAISMVKIFSLQQ